MNNNLNTTKVSVVAPVDLTTAQYDSLKEKIGQMLNSNDFNLTIMVDPSILGGLKIYIGTKIIDLSAEGALQEISVKQS